MSIAGQVLQWARTQEREFTRDDAERETGCFEGVATALSRFVTSGEVLAVRKVGRTRYYRCNHDFIRKEPKIAKPKSSNGILGVTVHRMAG